MVWARRNALLRAALGTSGLIWGQTQLSPASQAAAGFQGMIRRDIRADILHYFLD